MTTNRLKIHAKQQKQTDDCQLKARELKDHAQAAAGSCFPSAGTPVQMWAESKRTTPEPEVCLFVSVPHQTSTACSSLQTPNMS